MIKYLKKLGPGLLFAGSAVGVSHLVQSTKAGANFGFGLIWALVLINIIKFPFFEFGPRYAAATGENLLEGYKKLGKVFLKVYLVLSFATMFTIQAAVTIVTAGIASSLFKNSLNIQSWTLIILFFCLLILIFGKFKFLDKFMKIIIIILSFSTIIAVLNAFFNLDYDTNWTQVFPSNNQDIIFLIAFMGWMPAPLDVSIWQSIWVIEKQKSSSDF
jgi:Mn2+/Fe2+ NRAMP family transporter